MVHPLTGAVFVQSGAVVMLSVIVIGVGVGVQQRRQAGGRSHCEYEQQRQHPLHHLSLTRGHHARQSELVAPPCEASSRWGGEERVIVVGGARKMPAVGVGTW
jgi:hypothetical protein